STTCRARASCRCSAPRSSPSTSTQRKRSVDARFPAHTPAPGPSVAGSGFSALDHAMMARALRLAERGAYTTRPNPMVGCVIVRDGEVVGEGYHERAGGPHAEVFALEGARERAKG